MNPKLRTSREVYDQVRWDPRLDARRVIIGYESRREGMQELAFSDFVPGGDIPWHRVWYFRDDRRMLWDRRERLDQLIGPGAVHHTAEASEAPPSGSVPPEDPMPRASLSPLPVYRFEAATQAWAPLSAPEAEGPPPTSLTVVTYNVLFDRHHLEGVDPARRTAALLEQLERADADLIALQEVTPGFLAEVLAQPWVRAAYRASDSPSAETVTPYGLLLLSRVPLARLGQLRFTRDKRLLVAELDSAGGRLAVAVLHLMSDLAEGAALMRERHLGVLLDELLGPGGQPGAPDWLVVGDFNFGDEGPEERLSRAGLVDVWRALRPDEPGHTFDPSRNPLAKLNSVSGRARRLDRILLRGAGAAWAPRDISLLGEQAPASDHFGLRCTLESGARPVVTAGTPPAEDAREQARRAAPVHRTALVLIPPESLWAPIQRLRTAHDRHARRWMPHVTLLYGFVPEEHLEAAAALASEALASFEPFTLCFERLELFRHRGSCTLWARPDSQPPSRLEALQAALQAAFPHCDEQGRHSSEGFTGHLTLGQADVRRASETLAAWQRDRSPLLFEVREVQLISRRGEDPFEVRHCVPLGGGRRRPGAGTDTLSRWLERHATPSASERAARDEALAQVDAACATVLGAAPEGGPRVHRLGSEVLGVTLPGSDLDLLCVGNAPLSRERFFQDVTQALTEAGVLTHSRALLESPNPLLKLQLGPTEVDLLYAQLPPGMPATPPREVTPALRTRLEPASLRSLLALLEAPAVLARLREARVEEPFQQVLRAVRAWARARGLDSKALGLTGGVCQALLTARACVNAPAAARQEPEALLEHFFSTYAGWPWPRPVLLSESHADYRPHRKDVMPVPTLIGPVTNSARNVTRSTLALLREEWARGEALCRRIRSGAGTWEALFEPVEPLSHGGRFLLIEVRAPLEDALEHCQGWVEGHVLGLIASLEADPALRVRPFPGFQPLHDGGPASRLLLGLEGPASSALDAAAERFTSDFTGWGGRPEGSSLEVSVRSGLTG